MQKAKKLPTCRFFSRKRLVLQRCLFFRQNGDVQTCSGALPTALFWTVGTAPLQVWTSPFCRKTKHLCSTRRFLEKNLQVGSFFALCMLFQGPSEGSSGRTRDLQTRLWFDRKSSFSDPRNEKIRKLEMKTNNNPINSNDAGLQPLPGARKRSTRSRCKHRAVCNATGRHRFGVLTAARPVHGSC